MIKKIDGERWFDFSNGVIIPPEEIQKTVKEVQKGLKTADRIHIQRGGLLVVGLRYGEDCDIFVTERYRVMSYQEKNSKEKTGQEDKE